MPVAAPPMLPIDQSFSDADTSAARPNTDAADPFQQT